MEHFDVVIVGAGLSGVGAAHHLQDALPGHSYVILEGRERMGGTWDLFKYPGIRSDSDMHTLGYRFRPWTAAEAIADGPAILEYVKETAREAGIDRHVRYGQKVVTASWSTPDVRWTVTTEAGDEYTCSFLYLCSGYYDYDNPYTPELPGSERFEGEILHPQLWSEDTEYAGKRVVVIGSGATAVTLVPAMTDKAKSVTMLQRSPTYIVSLPGKDVIANALRRILPDRIAYVITRWKNVAVQAAFYQLSRRRPELVRKVVRKATIREVGRDVDVDEHFKPTYNPWDQRVCLVPDSDLFKALREKRAEIVTDKIETFTETGLRLESGRELEADLIITATGLNMQVPGSYTLSVDGEDLQVADRLTYRGCMLEGVPNHAFTVGYTNASWTLKADLTAEFVCRVLGHMQAHGHTVATPVNRDPSVTGEPILDFTSGYVQRALHRLPKQGSKPPWKLRQNYALDILALRHGEIDDGALEFSAPAREPAIAAA